MHLRDHLLRCAIVSLHSLLTLILVYLYPRPFRVRAFAGWPGTWALFSWGEGADSQPRKTKLITTAVGEPRGCHEFSRGDPTQSHVATRPRGGCGGPVQRYQFATNGSVAVGITAAVAASAGENNHYEEDIGGLLVCWALSWTYCPSIAYAGVEPRRITGSVERFSVFWSESQAAWRFSPQKNPIN